MSKTHRGFMMASVAIALLAALINWAASSPDKYDDPAKTGQIYYMPPDVQPNCVNEVGCDRKTRLPDWLNKHLGIEKKEATAQQDEYIQEAGNAAVASVFYGILIGAILYGLMAGLHYVYRAFIKPKNSEVRRVFKTASQA